MLIIGHRGAAGTHPENTLGSIDAAIAAGADWVEIDVKEIAEQHLDRITWKIAELEVMRSTLQTLISHCHGDDRPDCPILDDLAGAETGDCTRMTTPAG